MIQRKVMLSSIIILAISLISIFSLGIFQSVMNLAYRSDAAGVYVFGENYRSLTDDEYNNHEEFQIQSEMGFLSFVRTTHDIATSEANAHNFKNKTVKLTADITITKSAISTDSSAAENPSMYNFAGTFDGQAHTITYNMQYSAINYSGTDGVLCSWLRDTGIIRNVKIYNAHMYVGSGTADYTGIIVGENNGTVESCIVENFTFTSNRYRTSLSVGAIAGKNNGVIQHCLVSGTYKMIGKSKNLFTNDDGMDAHYFVASGNQAQNCIASITEIQQLPGDQDNIWEPSYHDASAFTDPSGVNRNYNGYIDAYNNMSKYVSSASYGDSQWYKFDSGFGYYGDGSRPIYLRTFMEWSTFKFRVHNSVGGYINSSEMRIPYWYRGPSANGATINIGYNTIATAYPYTAGYYQFGRWDYASSDNGYTWDVVATFVQLDTYNISFQTVDSGNLYYDSTNSIKPYLYDAGGNRVVDWQYATTSSDGTLVIVMPINTVINVGDDRSGYSDTTGGNVGVYNFNINGVTYYVKYHFESAVPNLTVSASGYTVTQNNTLKPTFGGGYVTITFAVVNNATMTDSSNKTLTTDQKYRVAKNSTVAAVYDQENFTWVTYSISGEVTVKYTCADTYLLSSTGLGSGLDESKNITSNTTVKPTIISKNDMVVLTFDPVIASDTVGNKIVNTPTRTGSGWSGSATAGYTLSLFPDSKIIVEEISLSNGQKGYGFTIRDKTSGNSYSIKFLTNRNDLYTLTSYKYSSGIKQTLSDILVLNQKTIQSTATVTVVAEYATVNTINFNVSNNAYLYAPIGDQVYDSNNNATANFGTRYINNIGADFKNFLDYNKTTYSIKIASDSANSSKPKLTRIESKTAGMYTITYVASYRLDGVSKKAEVAQYLTKNPSCRFTSDGYTEGSIITNSVAIKPVFEVEAFTFKAPSDIGVAEMYVNDTRQRLARGYNIGTNLTIGTSSATFETYSDVIKVDIDRSQLIYSFGVTRKIMTFAAGNVTTALNETEEVVTYKITDTYLNSAYLKPRYSDATISQSAIEVAVSAGLVIQPTVRTDYVIEFSTIQIGDVTLKPKVTVQCQGYDMGYSGEVSGKISYYDSGYTEIDYGYVEVTEDVVRVCRPYEMGGLQIVFEKRVDLENGKNAYVFAFTMDALLFDTGFIDHYEIVYELVDYPNYKVMTDVVSYDGSVSIDVDTLMNCEVVLKSYEIQYNEKISQ